MKKIYLIFIIVLIAGFVSAQIEIIGGDFTNGVIDLKTPVPSTGDTNASTACSGLNGGVSVLLGNSSCNDFPGTSAGGSGGGEISNETLSNTYYRLDTTNNPLTGNLIVSKKNAETHFISTLSDGYEIYLNNSFGSFPGVWIIKHLASQGRFGIINDSNNEVFSILRNGNLGIGIINPTHSISTIGGINISDESVFKNNLTSYSYFKGKFNWVIAVASRQFLSFNSTALSLNTTALCLSNGTGCISTGGGILYDQNVSTKNNVTFDNINATRNVTGHNINCGIWSNIGGDDDCVITILNGNENIEEPNRYIHIIPNDQQTEDYELILPPDASAGFLRSNGSGTLNFYTPEFNNLSKVYSSDYHVGTIWKGNGSGIIPVTTMSILEKTYLSRNKTTGDVQWTTAPKLSEILTSGNDTSGTGISFTTTDKAYFGGSNNYINSPATDILNISSANTYIDGDLRISKGIYRVFGDQPAFAYDGDTDARLFFDSNGAKSTYNFESTTRIRNLIIQAFGSNGNVQIKGGLGVGTYNWSGLTSGDINVSNIYYTALFQRSPFASNFGNNRWWFVDGYDVFDGIPKKEVFVEFDNDYNILRWNGTMNPMKDKRLKKKIIEIQDLGKNKTAWEQDKQICESQLYHTYVDDIQYRRGQRDCILDLSYADISCQVENNNRFYYYNQNSRSCVRNETAYCERIEWQYWGQRTNNCETNKYLECSINGITRNESWNGRSCVFDASIECTNRGAGWEWNQETNTCDFNQKKKDSGRERECRSAGRCFEWRDNQCINVCR